MELTEKNKAYKTLVEAAEKLKDILPLIAVPENPKKALKTGVIVGTFLKALEAVKKKK